MANEEQLSILKQGVEVWNEWREENLFVDIDLSIVDLSRNDLSNIDLKGANLSGADLSSANFREADLREANCNGTNLSRSDLIEANLSRANLKGAHFIGAYLNGANLSQVNLIEANLMGADLHGTNFSGAALKTSNFLKAEVGFTIFGDLDLSEGIGLEHMVHRAPSIISTNTIVRSKGRVPEVFLRGCGLSDADIEYAKLYSPDLSNEQFINIQNRIFALHKRQAIQISPLFISYSHADSSFVDKLEVYFDEKGIRFWRDIRDLKAGRMETQIDQAINQNRNVLLVLSKHSLGSDWVEHEVRMSRGLEKEIGRDVLCPVALDNSWKDSKWPKRVMEQIMEYNILDFSEWEDGVKFDGMFRKLIDGLELFYKG